MCMIYKCSSKEIQIRHMKVKIPLISTTPLSPDLARLCSINMRAYWCLSLEIRSGHAVLGVEVDALHLSFL